MRLLRNYTTWTWWFRNPSGSTQRYHGRYESSFHAPHGAVAVRFGVVRFAVRTARGVWGYAPPLKKILRLLLRPFLAGRQSMKIFQCVV